MRLVVRHRLKPFAWMLIAALVAPVLAGLGVGWHVYHGHSAVEPATEDHHHLHRTTADHVVAGHHHHDDQGEHSHDAEDHTYSVARLQVDGLRLVTQTLDVPEPKVETATGFASSSPLDLVVSAKNPSMPPCLSQLCTLLI